EALRRRLKELEAVPSPRASSGPIVLQVFWETGGGFLESDSVSTPVTADGEVRRYALRLPPTARGPLRLDPGNHSAYAEIHRVELIAADGDANEASGETLRSWSAADGDAPLIPVRGVTRLAGSAAYRFVCTDEDPQLLLDGVPQRRDQRP